MEEHVGILSKCDIRRLDFLMENEKITRSEKNEDILKNKKKRKHHKKKQNKLYLIIKITISIVCIFISLYFFVSLVKTNMIPNKYLLIAGGVLLLFNIVILLMLLYRKVWLNNNCFYFCNCYWKYFFYWFKLYK